MPLHYDEETGEHINVCIDCGAGPCSTFTDRCTRCQNAAAPEPEAAVCPVSGTRLIPDPWSTLRGASA